ncbi:MAG: 30S ribosome-binding factor RbfA [Micropruina sp.]|nr:30S ribosome-binding factor RbfA [Micropruina sp.]
MGNPRYIKVAEQIKVIVAEMLERRVKDPRLGFVTVTEVRLTGDGREATVFYTVLGDEQARIDSQQAMESARGLIRSAVGKQLGMKFTPSIAFVLDAIPESAAQMAELLARAKAIDDAVAAKAASASYAGEADPYRHPDAPDEAE